MANCSTGFVSRVLANEAAASILAFGCIEVRSGPPPATPDEPAAGTLLARITRDGGAWTAGATANGLQWRREGRYLIPEPGHIWRLEGIAAGEAGHFRILGNAPDDGLLSVDLPRIDGTILALGGTVPADFFLPSLTISATTTRKVDLFWFTIN